MSRGHRGGEASASRRPAGAPTPAVAPAVPVIAVAALLVLVALAGRYGYHGDELYFIVAGAHPALGYPDQPPLVPLIAWSMHRIAGSLYLLRLPAAAATGGTVLVSAAIARQLGGGGRAQSLAAGGVAVSAICLASGHYLSTTTFDVLSTTVLCWLLARALVRPDPRSLIWAGAATGAGVQAKPQVGLVAVVSVLALAVVGPHWVLRCRQLWIGVGVAAVLAGPYLLWQARHGWPQLVVAGHQAGSAEGGRAGFLPFQLVLVSPLLAPVWVAGLVSAWRSPALRPVRYLPLLYAILAAGYVLGDGKAYYLASLYPALLGVGSVAAASWCGRGPRPWRRSRLLTATVVASAGTALAALPVLPVRALPGSPAAALNPELGETVGWPQLVDTVGGVWRALPPGVRARTVIVTASYDQAGAIDILGRAQGLPAAFSGNNGFALWGHPPADRTVTILVGYRDPGPVERYFLRCHPVARIGNPIGLRNSQYGLPVLQCTGLVASWPQLWPRLRHYG